MSCVVHVQGKHLSDKPHLGLFVLSIPFDRVWFVNLHERWARNYDF